MHVLIVLAHPEKQSFNAHLAEETRQTWIDLGHEATLINLYGEDFDPARPIGTTLPEKMWTSSTRCRNSVITGT